MMDRERAHFGEVMETLKARFGDEAVAVASYWGRKRGSRDRRPGEHEGVHVHVEGTGKGTEAPIPDDMQEAAADEAHEVLVDRVAESDDELLEKYLEGEELSQEEIASALIKSPSLQGWYPRTSRFV